MWWARPDSAGHRHLMLLDEVERARHESFLNPADRDRYLASHALARLVLADTMAVDPASLRFARRCRRCGGPHGKPRLIGPGRLPELSLTHSGRCVGVAMAMVSVGLDVELAGRLGDAEILAEQILSVEEIPYWRGLPPQMASNALVRWWTRKEAVLKATGDGLNLPMPSFTVSPPDQPARLLDWAGTGSTEQPVQLHDLSPATDHPACVASLGVTKLEVIEHDGDALLQV